MLWNPASYPTDENEKVNPVYPYALLMQMGEDLMFKMGRYFLFDFLSLTFTTL